MNEGQPVREDKVIDEGSISVEWKERPRYLVTVAVKGWGHLSIAHDEIPLICNQIKSWIPAVGPATITIYDCEWERQHGVYKPIKHTCTYTDMVTSFIRGILTGEEPG